MSGPIECIKFSEGEFEFYTKAKGIGVDDGDGDVYWGRSENGVMWFTPDWKCVNRELLQNLKYLIRDHPEEIGREQSWRDDPWLTDVFDASAVQLFVKPLNVTRGTNVTFTIAQRNVYSARMYNGERSFGVFRVC